MFTCLYILRKRGRKSIFSRARIQFNLLLYLQLKRITFLMINILTGYYSSSNIFNILTGLYDHEETCVHLDEGISKATICAKGFLDFTNQRLSFDPEKLECSHIYNQTKLRILQECEYRDNSQKCVLDLSNDMSSNPECFQVYDFRILHTCEGEQNVKVEDM